MYVARVSALGEGFFAQNKSVFSHLTLLFLIYVWVPEVGNTADIPNPPWVLPL